MPRAHGGSEIILVSISQSGKFEEEHGGGFPGFSF